MKTKKILVAFDPDRPQSRSSDFAVPVAGPGGVQLVGIRSGKPVAQGVIVFLGREVTVNDVFARLVDSGQRIESVEAAVKLLGDYLTMLQEHKIGNVIALEPVEGEAAGFRLTKIANTPSGAADAGG
jgi:hypothetical protein